MVCGTASLQVVHMGANTGWYWHAYNSAGAPDSNVWGIFPGAATKLPGGDWPQSWHVREASRWDADRARHLLFHELCSNPNDPGYLNRKNSFGIFLGIKGADMPVDFQRLRFRISTMGTGGAYSTYYSRHSKAYNLHSGTAQFWKQIDQSLDFPDPPGGFAGMYLSRADTEAMIDRSSRATRVPVASMRTV